LGFILIGGLLFWLSLNQEFVPTLEGNYSLFKVPSLINGLWVYFVVLLVSFLSAYVVHLFNKKHRFVEGNSIPFILFTSIGLSASIVSSISVLDSFALLLSLLSLSLILKIHNQNSILGLLFSSSLLLGVATILFYPSVFLFGILFLTIAFFRPFEIRDYVVILVGAGLATFYFLSISFLLDLELLQFNSNIQLFVFSGANLIPLGFFSLFILVGVVKVFSNRSKFIVRQRNQFVIIGTFTIIQFTLFLLFNEAVFWISIVPILTIYLTYFYKSSNRKWILDIVSLLFIVLLIWLKF
jgi:hypothetical protein